MAQKDSGGSSNDFDRIVAGHIVQQPLKTIDESMKHDVFVLTIDESMKHDVFVL